MMPETEIPRCYVIGDRDRVCDWFTDRDRAIEEAEERRECGFDVHLFDSAAPVGEFIIRADWMVRP